MTLFIKLVTLFILAMILSNLRADYPVLGGLGLAVCIFVTYWQGGKDAIMFYLEKYGALIIKGAEAYKKEQSDASTSTPAVQQDN